MLRAYHIYVQRHSRDVLFDVHVKEYRIEVRMRNMGFSLAVCNEWTVKALLILRFVFYLIMRNCYICHHNV